MWLCACCNGRGSHRYQFGEQVVAAGHEYGPLAVLHLVGVVPHADFGAGEIGRIDGQCEVAPVGQHDKRLRQVGQRVQVGGNLYVYDRDAAV